MIRRSATTNEPEPDATLAEIRRIAHVMDTGTRDDEGWDLERLVEFVIGLDEWIVSGGVMPSAWTGSVRHRRSMS